MKWLKWTAVGLVTTGVLLAGYLWFWFDLDDVKIKLQNTVQQHTGRTLQIDGDLGWSVFPQLGLSFEKLTLSNPKGMTPATMLQIEQGVAEVALWPLLQQQIQIQQLSVDGMVLNWVKQTNGQSSMDGFTTLDGKGDVPPATTASKTPATTNKTATSASPLQNLQLQQLALTDVTLNLLTQGQPPQQLQLQSLTLNNFQPGQWAELTAQLQTKVGDKALQTKATMRLLLSDDASSLQLADLDIAGDLAQQQFELLAKGQWSNHSQQLQLDLEKMTFADSVGRGELQLDNSGKIPNLTAKLQFDAVDVRPWQSPSEAKATAPVATSTEPDLSALRKLNGKLSLTITKLISNTLTADDVQLNINNRDGVVSLEQAQAKLLQGQINASAKLDSRKPLPIYQFEANLQKLQIQPLLAAMADFDKLTGAADLQIKGQGQSLQPAKLQQLLTATGQFQIQDGAIVGANVAQMIRQFRATIKGSDESEAADLGNPQQTDFTLLTGEFSLADGVLQQSNLQLASPLLRLSGAGELQLAEQQLDYRLTTALVNSLKGQGGLAKDQLASVDIPLRIHGDLSNPKFQLDTKALYKNELKQKVDEKKQDLKQKLADKLREKLGG
ncbi:MAG: AsmA family protein [Gammaproteobacteria bacterium]|nr:AsmA family protein [Gammaproteobacteria bacterium]